MNDLLGYLLNLDEPEDRVAVERRLSDDPAVRRELDLLRRGLKPLEADREAPVPPRDLVARTIARVAGHICANQPRLGIELPTVQPSGESRLPRLSADKWRAILNQMDRREVVPSRWQTSDLVIAASVLLIGFGVVLAGLPYLRHRATLTACQNHMRQLYAALDGYADRHSGQFPQIPDDPSSATVASVLTELRQSGDLPQPEKTGCPASPLGFASYAYTLGYRDDDGRLHGLSRTVPLVSASILPLAADRPAIGRTSPNPDHRTGQNVLFLDGHIMFCTTGRIGVDGDDIYRNQLGQVRAGVSLFDTVLGVGGDRP